MQVLQLLRDTKDAVLAAIWTLLVYLLSVLVLFGTLITLGCAAVIEILPQTKRNTSLKESFSQLKTQLQEWLKHR